MNNATEQAIEGLIDGIRANTSAIASLTNTCEALAVQIEALQKDMEAAWAEIRHMKRG